MPELKWQLEINGRPVKGGKVISIVKRGCSARGVLLDLKEEESGAASTFVVRYTVNIGGKDYLLIHEDGTTGEELTAIRMLDKNRLSAMDPDRFSSLVNAIYRYLEETEPSNVAELAKVLGDLPEQ